MKKRIGIGDIFGRESERKPARGSVRKSMRRSMTLILAVVVALTLTALPAGASPADGAATGDASTPSAIVENSTLGQPSSSLASKADARPSSAPELSTADSGTENPSPPPLEKH